jgi:aminoglycoside phosphotransferase (APT) family kinase protein
MTDYTAYVGTRPVADALRFDMTALERFMREHVEGYSGALEVEQFKGGQSNPTYRLSAGGKRYVMRRKPPGRLLPSAHAVDREYRVITALAKTDVPVARTYALSTDESVVGTAFYIMDCVEGRVLWDPQLPGMEPGERAAIFDEMNRVIAALHRVDYAAIGLADYGKPGNYFQRQIDRWSRQYRASETEKIEAMDRLIEWLPANIPADDATSIVHGDYRIDNMIFHPREPRVLAVLDWELSTLGHPMADLSYHAMAWRLSSREFRGLRGVDLRSLGIPSEPEYVGRYLERTGMAGWSEKDWSFCMAYNMFRAAAIFQGVMARAVAGNAASALAADTGKRARPMAELGWAQVEALESGKGEKSQSTDIFLPEVRDQWTSSSPPK